jgi:hypothetical protein
MTLCQHQFDGRTCASPALTGQDLCYFHSRNRDRTPVAPDSLEATLTLPDLTGPAAILAALSTLTQAVAQNLIDPRRANLLLRALTLAAKLTTAIEKAAKEEKDSQEPTAPRPTPKTEAPTLPTLTAAAGRSISPALSQPHRPHGRLPRGLRARNQPRQPGMR